MTTQTVTLPAPGGEGAPSPRRLSGWVGLGTGLLAGLVAGVVGLLPWLLTDRRLPLQNLWSQQRLPSEMPMSLLPLSQYHVVTVLAMLLVGSVLAALAVRALPRSGPTIAGGCLGWLVVALVASGQSSWVVADGIERTSRGRVYLYAVLGALVVSIVLALVALPVVARASRPAAVPWLALTAVLAGGWVSALASGFGSRFGSVPGAIGRGGHWVAAALVGATLAWCTARGGRGTILAAWFVGLAMLWVVPAVATGVLYAAGSARSMPATEEAVRELLRDGARVAVRALEPHSRTLGDLALALVVGLVGAAILRTRARP